MRTSVRRLFDRGCVEYAMLKDGDKILLALSGGKDSLAMALLMVERARIFKPQIRVEAAHVVMDNVPYYTDLNYLQEFCTAHGLPMHVLHTGFDEAPDEHRTKCFLCARYRRKALFNFAVDNGFNKVALGHHKDDFLATMLMNLTFEGSFHAMTPVMPMVHYPLTLIRPLCLVAETDLAELASEENLVHQVTPCPYEDATKRRVAERLLRALQQANPEARHSMWHALDKQWKQQASILQLKNGE